MRKPVRWPRRVWEHQRRQQLQRQITEEKRRTDKKKLCRKIGKLVLFLVWNGVVNAMMGNRRR
jgi:hypothetical protein